MGLKLDISHNRVVSSATLRRSAAVMRCIEGGFIYHTAYAPPLLAAQHMPRSPQVRR